MRKLDPGVEQIAIEKGIIKPGEEISTIFRNLGRTVAQREEPEIKDLWAEKFFQIMDVNHFLPNYPALIHGTREDGQIKASLAACFVLAIDDSRDSIFETLKNAVEIQALGGGTGFNFSKLRQKGSPIKSTGGVSSGPVSFMNVYDVALGDTIRQGGKRAGANMGILHYSHPDILDFISVKADHSKLTNFNLSVMLDDQFIEKAKAEENFDLIEPHTKQKVGELNATLVLNQIAKNATEHGCPGVLFFDNANRNNPFDIPLEATNPCGETYLYPGEACNLGAINLKQVVLDGITDEQFKELVFTSVRFLDNVIDINYYPLPGMQEIALKYRKIGLGLMGIADALYIKRIAYNSEEGRQYVTGWYQKLQNYAVEATEALAMEKGPFGAIRESTFSKPRRNSYLTLQQPTGTLSILAGCSAGLEPWFGLIQTVTTSKGTELKQVNPILQQYLKKRKLWTEDLSEAIYENDGSIKGIKSIPEDIQEIFVTAHDISYQDHVQMQAVVQQIVDNSVSKTINFRRTSTVEDAKNAILMAHHLGCKGLTIYRDGSKENQPIRVKDEQQKKPDDHTMYKRKKVLAGQSEQIDLGGESMCGTMFVTINTQDNHVREVISNKGSSGGCANAMMEAIGRVISTACKHGTPIEEIISQLMNIKCDQVFYDSEEGRKPDKITSCPMAVGLALERFTRRNGIGKAVKNKMFARCPKCGEFSVVKDGSCEYCTRQGCGHSKC